MRKGPRLMKGNKLLSNLSLYFKMISHAVGKSLNKPHNLSVDLGKRVATTNK